MSLADSQRRDQRRRLVVSWNRSLSETSINTIAESGIMTDYSPQALPERQPALAMILPTSMGRLVFSIVGILGLVTLAIGVGICEPVLGVSLVSDSGRFSNTLAAVRDCFDLRSPLSIVGWLGQVLLLSAAVIALVVRLMRRERRDDYQGRYRAWGWLSTLFVMTACSGQLPIGAIVGTLVCDATGMKLGPHGIGWWLLLSLLAFGSASLWSVVPLLERYGTALWLSLGFMAWAASGACEWMGHEREIFLVVKQASWTAGSAFSAIAMLVAARSVIREVRGESARATAPSGKPAGIHNATIHSDQKVLARKAAVTPVESADELQAFETQGASDNNLFPSDSDDEELAFVDGSEQENFAGSRHLSKAERKRLKKLARIKSAA